MRPTSNGKYQLAPRTQVREEDFGLLFYTMDGPRLYFVNSGELIRTDFFSAGVPLEQWIRQHADQSTVTTKAVSELRKSLDRLAEKGVILEC